jgi:iron complex transport system permease protein
LSAGRGDPRMPAAGGPRRLGRGVVFAVLCLGLGLSGLGAVALGSVSLPLNEVARILAHAVPGLGRNVIPNWPDAHETIILSLRLPRVLLAAAVGAALSVAGGAFQGLFRNPMADPYVIGVSSGAALGAALALTAHPAVTAIGLSGVPLAAFGGALITVSAVYGLSRLGREVPIGNLLLTGVAAGAFLSAMVSLVIVFGRNHLDEIVYWLMGSLAGRGWAHLGTALPYLALGGTTLILLSRDLNALLLGEEEAAHLGVRVERTKGIILAAGSLLTAAAVATCGVVGFVGLVVPHIARLVVGPDHRVLLPVSALAGSLLLVAADLVARLAVRPGELPVGVVTALIGGPFFLYLLGRSRSGVM